MNSQYETFLRKDIFPNQQEYADIVIDVYEKDPTQRHYISMVIEDYISGGSQYQAYKRLWTWVINPNKITNRKIEKKFGFLEDEFKEKMRWNKNAQPVKTLNVVILNFGFGQARKFKRNETNSIIASIILNAWKIG